jgi:hypothetical protein
VRAWTLCRPIEGEAERLHGKESYREEGNGELLDREEALEESWVHRELERARDIGAGV